MRGGTNEMMNFPLALFSVTIFITILGEGGDRISRMNNNPGLASVARYDGPLDQTTN